MIVDPTSAPESGETGLRTLHLSVAGGLTQVGAYIDTLAPGAWSSFRHWHEAEDEFVLVLDGVVTLRDDSGMQDLLPGDAVCWRHGDPNGHHLTNRGSAPVRYLIVGSRVAGDVCHYPDTGRRLLRGATTWQLQGPAGELLDAGEQPPELRDLPPVWGRAFDGSARPLIQRAATRQWQADHSDGHPVLGGGLGQLDYVPLGEIGGMSQFGVQLDRLAPGGRSSFRHWHEAEDEMVLALSGQLTLIEAEELPLPPGGMACWPAGHPVGHCLRNDGAGEAIFLTIGTRLPVDVIHYTDHDLITHKHGATRRYLRRDGTPHPERRPE